MPATDFINSIPNSHSSRLIGHTLSTCYIQGSYGCRNRAKRATQNSKHKEYLTQRSLALDKSRVTGAIKMPLWARTLAPKPDCLSIIMKRYHDQDYLPKKASN